MFKVAILTASDRSFAGQREDVSTQVVKELVEQAGYQVVCCTLLPDERDQLAAEMRRICDGKIADLLLTTGGTGFSPRDCMPEATMDVAERLAPGLAEAMRYASMNITKRAMLSRAVSVIRGGTLIINLPGSPKAARENLTFILSELNHGLEILTGRVHDCARSK